LARETGNNLSVHGTRGGDSDENEPQTQLKKDLEMNIDNVDDFNSPYRHFGDISHVQYLDNEHPSFGDTYRPTKSSIYSMQVPRLNGPKSKGGMAYELVAIKDMKGKLLKKEFSPPSATALAYFLASVGPTRREPASLKLVNDADTISHADRFCHQSNEASKSS
jgi:hypothetical protein